MFHEFIYSLSMAWCCELEYTRISTDGKNRQPIRHTHMRFVLVARCSIYLIGCLQ